MSRKGKKGKARPKRTPRPIPQPQGQLRMVPGSPFVQDANDRYWTTSRVPMVVPSCPDCPPCVRAGSCIFERKEE